MPTDTLWTITRTKEMGEGPSAFQKSASNHPLTRPSMRTAVEPDASRPCSPDHVGRDAAAGLLRLRQLLVRRRGGVDDQRLGVAHLIGLVVG